jgi:hypothetical protein
LGLLSHCGSGDLPLASIIQGARGLVLQSRFSGA